ncbi:cupin domain-containing protein [Microbacterium sp. lyk4-40-TSB-66]|uniref:JmjC domain-containing protein n=1 Tax=Microbacterium sp. lyk4-40-TSB-66 TaxID=3040294 RepID=UPI002550D545|nr:cupin domain-containing protein [Microbacterium sp. lyk4-40-TSB-66]
MTDLSTDIADQSTNRFSDTFALRSTSPGLSYSLLDPEAVGTFLSHPIVCFPQLRVALSGKGFPLSAYVEDRRLGTQSVNDGVSASAVAVLIGRGATATIDSLKNFSAPVWRICERLTADTSLTATATAYDTPPGKPGLTPHTDEEDVIVLQTSGTKRWVVHGAQKLDVAAGAGFPFKDQVAAVEPFLMAPGDAFFMPAGTPHVATATDQLSVHTTFSVERPHMKDALADVMTNSAKTSPEPQTLVPWGFTDAHAARLLGATSWGLTAVLREPSNKLSPFATWGRLSSPVVDVSLNTTLETDETNDRFALRFPEFTMKVGGEVGQQLVRLSLDSPTRMQLDDTREMREVLFHLIGRGALIVQAVSDR